MLLLSNLRPAAGSRKNMKRVGRGVGSGTGKTCGKGQKGQKSRSGGGPHPWFEGGQMALQRRLPKRGFHSPFKKYFEIVNIDRLQGLSGDITPEVMKEKGIIKKLTSVKILGTGDLKEAITVHAHQFSQTAKEKIETAGGKVIVIK